MITSCIAISRERALWITRSNGVAETLDQRTRLHHQLANLRQYPGQHLAFVRFARGKQMMCFDRAQDRLHLFQGAVESLNASLFQLRQGAATALRQPPQDARFVGIANGEFLRRGVGRQTPLVDKAKAMRLLDHQAVDLVDARFAQRRIGPGDVGVVANLGLGHLGDVQ